MIAPPGSAAAPYYTGRRRTSPGRAAPGCRRSARTASRSGTWSPPGTTRASPATTCSWPSGPYCAGSLSTFQTTVGRGRRQRRGLGALRRAADGRARLPHRPRRPAGLPRRPAAARGPGGHRHRHAPGAADPRRRRRASSPSTAGSPGRRSWPGPSSARTAGATPAFLDSELVRYLGMPGQAISYKLGERAWLAGREAARAARGDAFDLKAWHMAALSARAASASTTWSRPSPSCEAGRTGPGGGGG